MSSSRAPVKKGLARRSGNAAGVGSSGSSGGGTGVRYNGLVKSFNRRRKFGFITVLTGKHTNKDVFVHISDANCKNEHNSFLVPGEYVQLSISTNEKGLNAVAVTGIEGNDLLCDRPYFMGIIKKLNKLTHEMAKLKGTDETTDRYHSRRRDERKVDDEDDDGEVEEVEEVEEDGGDDDDLDARSAEEEDD